uniref:Uncharacterized protein n=1 Tax=Trichuris muris TaxID=70415 RepID=A0A5S6QSP8_TRIMR
MDNMSDKVIKDDEVCEEGTDAKSVGKDGSSDSSEADIYEGHFKWIEGEKNFFYINSPQHGTDVFVTTRPYKYAHNGYSPPEEEFEAYTKDLTATLMANLMKINIEDEVVQKRRALAKYVRALNKRDNIADTDEQASLDQSPHCSATREESLRVSPEASDYPNDL